MSNPTDHILTPQDILKGYTVTIECDTENDKAFLLNCIRTCQNLRHNKNGEQVNNIPVDSNTSGLIASILSRATINPHGMLKDDCDQIINSPITPSH